eukprot:6196724-Pleurochrysis_carterae.AAC.3
MCRRPRLVVRCSFRIGAIVDSERSARIRRRGHHRPSVLHEKAGMCQTALVTEVDISQGVSAQVRERCVDASNSAQAERHDGASFECMNEWNINCFCVLGLARQAHALSDDRRVSVSTLFSILRAEIGKGLDLQTQENQGYERQPSSFSVSHSTHSASTERCVPIPHSVGCAPGSNLTQADLSSSSLEGANLRGVLRPLSARPCVANADASL